MVVYASHWFDMPHVHGMRNFRDFLDWTEATLEIARERTDINWLFKNHPCEDWYGGVTLHDLFEGIGAAHIRLIPRDWNNFAVLQAADAIITCHGTVGIEAAALGKPVLVSDRGWYDECGFVRPSPTREAYLDTLQSNWWQDHDAAAVRERALLFAGYYFCIPRWQESFLTADDAYQNRLYGVLEELLDARKEDVVREIDSIARWYESTKPFLHTFKMQEASEFSSPVMPALGSPR